MNPNKPSQGLSTLLWGDKCTSEVVKYDLIRYLTGNTTNSGAGFCLQSMRSFVAKQSILEVVGR